MTASRGAQARRSGGFTLLELLVVVVVSAALVALLGLIYRQVQRTGQSIAAVESDWQVQMFLRRQLVARDERFDRLELDPSDSTHLRLVSRASAAHAMAGPPVLAEYIFEPNAARLVYRETPLPPWWLDDQSPADFRNLLDAQTTLAQEPQVLLEGVTKLAFDYGDGSASGWTGVWLPGPDREPPALVRLRFERLGKPVVWTMPTQLLRFPLPALPLLAPPEAPAAR